MRDGTGRRTAAAIQRKVLPDRDALHSVRPRNRIHVPVGGGLSRDDPWAPVIFWSMLSFVSILMLGYIYALRKGVLDWKS